MGKRAKGKISRKNQRRRTLRNYYVAAAGIILFASCGEKKVEEEREVLINVYDENLYLDEVYDILPDTYTQSDSAEIVDRYINNWIREQVMLHHAEQAVSAEAMDLKSKLKKYRNSLLIYEYEKQWVKSHLDTVITEEELKTYYDTHQEEFELDDYLVKAVFIKVQKEIPKTEKIAQLYDSRDSTDLAELEVLCRENAENYYLDPESWLYFDDLLKLIPEEMIYNKENFVINRRKRRYEDEQYLYLINVVDYRFGVSPLDFERENIKSRILQQRTSQLRRQLREDKMNKAYDEQKIIRNEN